MAGGARAPTLREPSPIGVWKAQNKRIYCVRSFDAAGNASTQSCSTLRITK
ncbi:MAG TPA: hypothetical protein VLW05_00340 [Gaiellaceae bacterium]|nr:hypothetical protein [Gaiellaceae bacterium]